MGGQLPRPVTEDHLYLAAVVDRLDTQNAVLAEIRDRLPAPTHMVFDGGKPGVIAIREPITSETVDALDRVSATPVPAGETTTATPTTTGRRTPAKKAASTAKKGTPNGG